LRHWLLFGPAWYRRSVRERWYEKDPLTWMLVRPTYKSVVIWSIVLLSYVFFYALRMSNIHHPQDDFLWFAWLALALFKIALAVESSQGLAREIREEEWEALLGSPMRDAEYITAHWRALRALFMKPWVAMLLLLGVIFYFGTPLYKWAYRELLYQYRLALILRYSGLLLIFLLDCWALGWVGLWQGLRCRRQASSSMHTMILILGAPWLLASLTFLGVTLRAPYPNMELPNPNLHYYLLLFYSVLLSVGLGAYAQWQVRTHFRTLALRQRYEQAPLPLGQRILRGMRESSPNPQSSK
jgi:hypothetical protein